MSTSMNTLLEDCVQLIFDRIPTQHLFTISRVSRSWQHHQQLNCRRRKSLIIVQGEWSFARFTNLIYNQPFIEHSIDQNGNSRNHKFFLELNQISISTNKPLDVNVLVSIFPNLHSLTVATSATLPHFIEPFVRLIECYFSKLLRLELYFGEMLLFKEDIHPSFNNIMGNLMNQLNSFCLLQHFTFHIYNLSIKPEIDEPKFITRLKEFYFHCFSLEGVMLDWVRKYSQDERLDRLNRIYITSYPYPYTEQLPIKHFDKFPLPNLYPQVPSYKTLVDYDEKDLERIVSKFPSISTISCKCNDTVECPIIPITQMATILSPLTKLVHIRLNFEIFLKPESHLDQNYVISQLQSIKGLDIEIDHGRVHLDKLNFADIYQTLLSKVVYIFPNLQSIQIINCGYEYFKPKQRDAPTLDQCIAKFSENLKLAYGRSFLRTRDISAYETDLID